MDTLFQELGTRLCYERAEDPNAFLIQVSPAPFSVMPFLNGSKIGMPSRMLKDLSIQLLVCMQVLEEMRANKAAAQSTLFFTKEDV